MPSRDNYDLTWLVPRNADPSYTKFVHRPMSERPGSREAIRPCLGQAIIEHHVHVRRIASLLEQLGYTGAADAVRRELPSSGRTRKGNFGEVVASEHLVQRYKYEMPVLRLLYRDAIDMPMRGEDIVAFVRDDRGAIIRLCVAEAKTRTRFASQAVIDAHARLSETYSPRPETLSLIANILYGRGEDQLGAAVDRVQITMAESRVDQDNWIVLITGSCPRRPFRAIEDLDDVLPSLFCVDLQLDDLSEFATNFFEDPQILL